MKLTSNILTKVYHTASSALLAFALLGCHTTYNPIVDCESCFTTIPTNGLAKIKLTIDRDNSWVPITVYYGAYEKNIVAFRDTSNVSIFYLKLKTDIDYTIRAEYKKELRTYYVINGVKLKVHEDTESCDEPCFYVFEKTVDLQIH